MSGPSVKRSDVSTAPIPGLTQPTTDLLMGVLRNPRGMAQRLSPAIQPSALQRQTGNTFSQLLKGPTAQERAFNIALPQIQSQLAGIPGMDVVNAANPIFQQNLTDALARQRQFGGPRFAAESGRQSRELEQRSLQDFNLFQQQVFEAGRQRQLQAAGVLGALGGGADTSRLGVTQGAGNFALGEQGLNLQSQQMQQALMQFLLGAGFTAGGANAAPVITQSPGFFGNLMGAIGGIGGLIPGLGGLGSLIGGGGGGGNPIQRTQAGVGAGLVPYAMPQIW